MISFISLVILLVNVSTWSFTSLIACQVPPDCTKLLLPCVGILSAFSINSTTCGISVNTWLYSSLVPIYPFSWAIIYASFPGAPIVPGKITHFSWVLS